MSIVRAKRYVASVDLIDPDELASRGVRCVLLDRDNTIVPRDTKVAPPKVTEWLRDLREVGISVCMVSNNFHTAQVERSAREMGMAVVHHAMKPAPTAVRRALRKMGTPAKCAVLVGDQLFTDVMAGNLAGVDTILVRPQSQVDLWYTQLFRKVESLFLRGVCFEGE